VRRYAQRRNRQRSRTEDSVVTNAGSRWWQVSRPFSALLPDRRKHEGDRRCHAVQARHGVNVDTSMPKARAFGVSVDVREVQAVISHIEESDLILYAFNADAVPGDRHAIIREHLTRCAECQATVDFFATAEEDLTDVEVWERIIGSDTYASLMEFAARISSEDETATALLADFLESPASAAWTDLVSKRRFHTGGVVRKLTSKAHSLCEIDHLASLTFADAAISVAEILPDDAYPARAVYQLRGAAWKERAIAQMLLGDFPAALDSLNRAERAYRRLATPALGLAMVALVRSGRAVRTTASR
jgi:hypothetical protein